MGQFNGMTLTNQGLTLQIKTIAESKPLCVTRVVLGKGTLPAGADIRAAEALADPVMDLPIISKKVTGTGTGEIKALLSNKNVAAGFYAREVGVFAAPNEDGSGEILYSYSYSGDNCDYIPSGGGADVINYILTTHIIIDRITSIVANIDANLAFATQEELQAHIDDPHAHPNLPHIGDPFGEDAGQGAIQAFWVDTGDGRLHRATAGCIQKEVLDPYWANSQTSNGRRIDHLERIVGGMALALDANMMYQDADAFAIENFDNPDQVDMMEAQVVSVVSGDDSIDLTDIAGLVVGAYYMLTDGESQELVRIKSLHVAGGTRRAILDSPVVNEYVTGRAKLYRSSVAIHDGKAWGGGNIKTDRWEPGETFTGSSSAQPAAAAAAYVSQNDFTTAGAAVFESGRLILGSPAVGVALVSEGGGAGAWRQINAGGDNL